MCNKPFASSKYWSWSIFLKLLWKVEGWGFSSTLKLNVTVLQPISWPFQLKDPTNALGRQCSLFFSFLFFIRWCRKGHFRADVKRTGLLRYEEISSSQKMQVYSRLNLDFLRCSVARTEMWSLGSGHSLTPIAIYYISPHTVWLTYQKSFRVLTTPRFRSNRHVC